MTQTIPLTDDDDDYEWWDENIGEEAGITFFGHGGHDNIEGDRGDDIIYGEAGFDQLYGGSFDPFDPENGFPPVEGVRGFWGHDILDGGEGNDTLLGGTGNDTFFGGPGTDAIYAGGGNDKIYPGIGAFDQNRMYGGADNDFFYAENNAGNYYDGGDDTDWVIFGGGESLDSSPVIVALDGSFSNAGQAQGDTFTRIENLRGSWSADTLAGDNNPNILEGGPGNSTDTLYGRVGADTLDRQPATHQFVRRRCCYADADAATPPTTRMPLWGSPPT